MRQTLSPVQLSMDELSERWLDMKEEQARLSSKVHFSDPFEVHPSTPVAAGPASRAADGAFCVWHLCAVE